MEGFNTVDSGLQVLGFGFLVGETWIPDFNRSRDSEILEVNSRFTALDSGVLKQTFSGNQYLTWGDMKVLNLAVTSV